MHVMPNRMGGLVLVSILTLAAPSVGRAATEVAPPGPTRTVDVAHSGEVVVAELTDDERDRLEELERQIKKEEEEAYRKGVRKGRTTAALWGCGTAVVAVAAFYVIAILSLFA
ncbi:MAG: hypothetical protein HYY13_13595 [Nitrospirae bacterium]|nr:hypothetical protein [Nitrospirota bacterium]